MNLSILSDLELLLVAFILNFYAWTSYFTRDLHILLVTLSWPLWLNYRGKSNLEGDNYLDIDEEGEIEIEYPVDNGIFTELLKVMPYCSQDIGYKCRVSFWL